MKKQLLITLIALCMAFTLLPTVALADDGDVAQIGEKSYASLQEAVDAAEEGQTIKLLKDIVLESPVTITSEHNAFTLDLNSKQLYGGGKNSAIRHSGSNTLTILDSSESGRGRINSATPKLLENGTIYLEGGTNEDTVLIIESGSVVSSDLGNAILHKGAGGVVITGTATVQNYSSGRAIDIASTGKVTVSGNAVVKGMNAQSTIFISTAKANGPVLEITGGTIENTRSGYGVYSNINNVVSIPGGTSVIKGNNAVNKAVDLSRYTDVRVMASEYDINGARAEEIHPSWFKLESYAKSYKYLKFSPAPHIARIGDKEYTSLNDAFFKVQEGQTVVLLEDINLKESLYPEKSFTLDLNGKTISETVDAGRLPSYLGMIVCWEGALTITDSSGGGTVAGQHTAFYLGGDASLNIKGGLVKKTNSQGHTIFHDSSGKVAVSDGIVQNGSSYYNAIIVRRGGTVEVTGGKVESPNSKAINIGEYGHVIVSGGEVSSISITDDGGKVTVSGGQVGTGGYAISDDNKYGSGVITLSGGKVKGYIKASAQGKIAITGEAVIEGIMSKAPDFTDMVEDFEWRTSQDGGFTPSTTAPYAWKYTDNYLEIKKISRVETVSNMLNTIWLSGGGFQFDDLLNTKTLSSGGDYDAMMKLKEENDVTGATETIAVYALSLNSGMKLTGNDMYVNFKLPAPADYAGQMLTLVYKKADGAYEYFYANADAEGRVQFGPIRELSAVMLAKGLLPSEPMNVEEMNTQAGGVYEMYILGINVWWFIGVGAALVIGAGIAVVVVLRKRKKKQG
jgi:uncharacterized protein YdeI (BOF family)